MTKPPYNILFIIVQMGMGGSERLVLDLINHLDRSKFKPSLGWFYGDTPLDEFVQTGIPLYHVRKERRIDLTAVKRIESIVRNNNIQLVNAHHFLSFIYGYYACKTKNKTRLVYTEHSSWELESIGRKWKIFGSRLLRNADALIGVSSKVADQFSRTFNLHSKNVHTVLNGVELDKFLMADKREPIRTELQIKNDDIVIGCVANFKRVKNHIFLLEGFAIAAKCNPKLKLFLIGSDVKGDPENTLKDIIRFIEEKKLENRVKILGFRTDIPDLLNSMDIFCLTSHKEGLPISILEAMATGLPVIGTDVAGIRDIINNDENGILVPTNSSDELGKAILSLADNVFLRQKLGNRGIIGMKEHFSMEVCSKKYQEIFLSALEGSSNIQAKTKFMD